MITYGSTTLTSYNSITSTEVYYYKSSSATALSGGSWSTTKPAWENGKYIWQKIRTLYEDETYTESDPVNITGQQGATGAAAYSYKLNASDTIIGKTKTGEYTVNKITFSATSKQGTSAVTAYSGRFKIETTEDGSTWTTSYTSSANESSKEFTIPENIVAVKCSLYQAGGVTVLLDIVTIPVVKDGVDAIGLKDSIPIYLASDKATGVTKLDLGWTRYRPELTVEKKYLWVYYVSRFSEGDTDPELIEIKDDVVSFENNGDVSPVESCIVDINPIQEINESEEVNPISGWNNITATRVGKNLFDINIFKKYSNLTVEGNMVSGAASIFNANCAGSKLKDKILIPKKQGAYTLSVSAYTDANASEASNGIVVRITHTDNSYVQKMWANSQKTPLRQSITSDSQKEVSYISITFGSNGNNIWHLFDIQFELNEEATDYEPYQRTDYQCSVESEENKNLVVYDKEPYLFRKSKSSQIKFLEEDIVGGTVCWNQFVQNGNFADDTNNWQVYPSSNGTLTATNNIATFTMNQTSSAKAVMQQVNKIPVDHVVLWGCDVKTTTDNEKTHVCIYYNSSRSAASNINTRLWLASPEIGYDDTWHNRNIITRNADANAQYILVGTVSQTTYTNITVEFKNVQLFDLTQMFGTEIANYIFELEQSKAGTGVAWFKKYFPYSFYDYNAGEMLSVEGISQKKIIGKNLLPMNIQTGSYKYNMTISINSDKSFYVNKPDGTGWGEAEISRIFLYAGTYTLIEEDDSSQNAEIACYNENDILVTDTRYSKIRVFDIPQNGYYTFKYWRSAAATNVLTKMSLLYGDMSLSDYLYESYYENIYPLDSSLTLKGIPKLDDNKNLYYDGDIYKSDGTVERRYGVVDLGTLTWGAYTADYGKSFYATPPSSKLRWYGITPKYAMNRVGSYTTLGDKQWTNASGAGYAMFVRDDSYTDAASFKTAMSGVYLVYELAEPTTEQAQSYASSQLIDDWSTEEYITDSIVPVGHETNYYNNTVYGGQYNITTGELAVTHDVVDLGALTYSVRYTGTNNKVLSTDLPFNPESGLSLIAENYAIMGSVAGAAALSPPDDHDKGIYRYGSQNSKTIYIVCGVEDNPKGKLVYKIAEPKTYSLTPQEVTALTGQNYVYADSGEVTIDYYDNQKSTEPYVDYATTTALEASINAFSNALGTLEAPYTEVEWVESTGKQYIYLDWKPPINTWGFEADFICRNANNSTSPAWNEATNINGYGIIFGTRNASGVNDVEFGSYQNGTLRIGNGTNQTTGFKTDHSRQTVKLRGNIITKADDTTSTITRLSETPDKKYSNMAVFALYEGLRRAATGGVIYPTTTRIYSLKFYDEDTLTVDLVGAIRKRDKVTGLYDKVSKHFYPAAGMLYGEEVGDIGNIPTLTESVEKANIRTTVVNKGCSRMWEASVPLEQLEDGQKITVVYSYGDIVSSLETDRLIGWDETKSNSYVYLKLNLLNGKQTDWIPCYYSQTTRLTTHYGAGIPILLTYRENALSSATATAAGNPIMRGFFADANYNVDNNTVGVYGGTVVAGANGVKKYSLIMKDTATTWTSFTTNSGDGTTKTRYTGGLYPDKILYMGGSSDYAATKTTGTCYEALALSLRYSTNCGTTLATSKPVYLVGELHNDGLFYLDETWWTQTVPTAEDNKIYIYLGMAYSNYQIYLATENPMYQFYNGEFILYSKVEALKNLEDLRDDLESQIDEKIQTYYQSTNPATSWTTADMRTAHDGDLWYYTGTTTSTYTKDNVYRYNGSNNTWSVYSASGELFDKVDGKSTIYYGTTSGTYTGVETGDYLVDSTDGSSYRWDGSKWVKVTDYKTTITNAIDDIEIGGRNLLIKKELGIYAGGNITYDTNKISATETGVSANGLTVNSQIPGWKISGLTGNVNIIVHGVTNLPSKTVALYYTCWNGTTKTKAQANFSQKSVNSDGSFEYKATLVIPSESTHITLGFGQLSASTYELSSLKMECGNKSTAWTPAPEDIFDNLEIGGRNLLINSESFKPSQYPYTNSVVNKNTNQPDPFDNEQCYYASGSSGYVKVDFPNLEIGKQYIFSVEVARHSTGSDTPVYIGIGNGTKENVGTATALNWKRFFTSFTATEETTSANVRLYSTSGANSYVGFFRHFKLEQGTKSTDWTSAPEDLSNIEVGGRNLLRKSNCFVRDDIYSNSNTQVTYPEPGIIRIAPTSSTAMYGKFKIDYLNYKDYEKSEITVSFEARIPDIETTLTQEPNIRVCLAANVASRYATAVITSNYDYYGVKTITNITNEWKRYQCSFSVADDLKMGKIAAAVDGNYLCLQFGQTSGRIPVEIRLIKMETGKVATAWTPAPEDVEESIKTYAQSIQSQVDGMAEIHYGTEVPSLTNVPASSWTDDNTKDMHVNDLYYNTFTGYCYRFTKSGSTYSWTRIKDSDITAAATAASNANTLAGQKRRIFVAIPTTPYEVGDLWVEGSNGDIKKCKTARASGSYTASDWELASKYTDDTTANEANDKIDNLEIGGRNLLPFKDCSSETLTRGGITLTKEEDGWIRVSGTRSGTSLTTFTLWQNPDGDTYTAPINSYVPQNGNTNQFTLSVETEGTPFIMSNTYTSSTHIVAYGSTSGTSWRIGGINGTSITGVFPTYMSVIRYYIGANSTGTVNGRFRVKLERGNKVTDWTPAPEDTETAISNAQDTANTALIQSSWYAICDTAGATVNKVATISPATTSFTLREGTTAIIKFVNTNSGAIGSLKLNVNNTGAKPIKYIYNGGLANIPSAGYLKGGQSYQFYYDGTNWVVQMIYNTNTNTVGVYGGTVTAGTNGIRGYTLIMRDTENTWVSITTDAGAGTKDGGTGTNHVKYAGGLYPDSVMYESTQTNYAAGASAAVCYLALSLNLRYSTNCGTTLIKNKPVYLVGELHNDGLFYLDDIWWTQTIPTTENGKIYIYLGMAYSNYQIYLATEKPMYQYYDGEFMTYEDVQTALAAKSATNYMSSDNTGIMVADMTDGVEKLPSDTTLTGSNVFITAGYGSGNTAVPAGVHIRDGRTDIARFGATAQIGKDNEGHVLIDNDSVEIKNGQDVLASFGESTYIGKNNGYHMLISPNDFIGISDSNAEYFKISGYVSTKTLSSNETITETTGYRTGRYFSYRVFNTPLDSSTVSVQEVFYDENYTELNARHFEQVYHYEAPSSDPDMTTWKWEENISEIPAGVGNRPQQQLTIDEELFDQENGLEIGVHLSEASVKYVVFRVTYKPANSTVAVVNPYYTFGYRKDDYNVGVYSFAEGANIIASGEHSHAEGEDTIASGQGSHAEGAVTTANGDYSHIEGYNGTANGDLSHVEGEACVANGFTSHAQGVGTIADSDAQMVLGRLNMPDSSNKYAVIVGNGDTNRRSDAFRLTWDGDLLLFYQNNNPSQGTLDYDLKQAIDALNWGGDIIVG